jgi:hypothetical protein
LATLAATITLAANATARLVRLLFRGPGLVT